MEKSQPNNNFVQSLRKVIRSVEGVAILVSFIGIAFKYINWTMANELLILGLFSIAITLFLSAFQLMQASNKFILVIHRLGYISSAVAVVAILFTLLSFEGSNQMLTVALPSLIGVVVMTGVFAAKQEDALRLLRPMLMRAVPLLLCCLYLFMKLPKIEA